jgi:hypothetical protein
MEIITEFKEWFFKQPSHQQSISETIIWWEVRRLPYNFIVGLFALGFLFLFLFFIDRSQILLPGEDAIEPLALFVIPVLWNIAYTSGWIVELCACKFPPLRPHFIGSKLLRWGLIFSLLVTSLPAIYWGIHWLFFKLL